MNEKRYIDLDKAVDIGYLGDWYQSSIDTTVPPIWTDEHLEELCNDFIIIPNNVIPATEEENERLLRQAKSEALIHASSKFAGHSDYHGDTILCQLICLAEGKETKSAKPIDINKIKLEAIKEFAERLKIKVKMYNSEEAEEGDLIDDLLLVGETIEIIDDLVKEMKKKKKGDIV